jgi:hypothetical protein
MSQRWLEKEAVEKLLFLAAGQTMAWENVQSSPSLLSFVFVFYIFYFM